MGRDHLTCSGSEFQRVVTANEKARVPAWALTLGTDNKCKKQINGAFWAWDLKKAWKIDMNVLQKKDVDRWWYRVLKCCEIEQGALNEVISGVAQNEKTEETMWQP